MIRQEIAQRLANDALEGGVSSGDVATAVRRRRSQAPTNPNDASLLGDIIGNAQINEQQIGLSSVFEIVTDPALSERLKTAGFDFEQYIKAVTDGNESVADSVLQDLEPAAQKLADILQAENPTEYADQITFLNGVVEFGAQALGSYNSAGSELREAIKKLVFEQKILGGAFEETNPAVEDFWDALKSTVEDTYGPINAQRQMEEAISSLGSAFATESPGVVANSKEMQSAISSIIDTAANPEDAISGLEGLYSAILDGGYASRDELQLLADQIIATYKTAAEAKLGILQDERNTLQLQQRDLPRRSAAIAKEIASYGDQIKAQEQSIKNIDKITIGTGNSAKAAGLLANGFTDAKKAASGTKDQVEEIEQATEQAVRTLLDYAGDLESVFSRAFGIRFGGQSAVDDIAAAWESFTDNVNGRKERCPGPKGHAG